MQLYDLYAHANYENNKLETIDLGCKYISDERCLRVKVNKFAIVAFAALACLFICLPKIIFNAAVCRLSQLLIVTVATFIFKDSFKREHSSLMYGAFVGNLKQ